MGFLTLAVAHNINTHIFTHMYIHIMLWYILLIPSPLVLVTYMMETLYGYNGTYVCTYGTAQMQRYTRVYLTRESNSYYTRVMF